MENWKEVPHLFANGKFKLNDGKYTIPFLMEYIWDGFNGAYFKNYTDNEYHTILLKDATLVARPISDMTDNECHAFIRLHKYDTSADVIRRMPDKTVELLNIKSFIYLLSIGVYPFDQSHFGDTVIDIKEVA